MFARKNNDLCPGLRTIPFQQNYEGLEIKSGNLFMIQDNIYRKNKTEKLPVLVRVYKTLFEHYAVVYRNEKVPNTATYISLKNCQVSQCDGRRINVIPNNLEGTKVIFEIPESDDVTEWLTALTPTCNTVHDTGIQSFTPPSSPRIPKSPTMPPVQEDDEK